MLKKTEIKSVQGGKFRFAVIASTYNTKHVDSMLEAALAVLAGAGAKKTEVVRVPGAFEIPVVAAALARRRRRFDAIICLGVIIRGETTHAEHIGTCVSQALSRLQIEEGVPMIHEVLLLENLAQADKRCLDPSFNRGREAAQTALEMARVMRQFRG